jgi:hypothetical protein
VGSTRRITLALVGLVLLVLVGWFVQARLADDGTPGSLPDRVTEVTP